LVVPWLNLLTSHRLHTIRSMSGPHTAMVDRAYYPQCLATASDEYCLHQAHMGCGVWTPSGERPAPACMTQPPPAVAGHNLLMVVISGLDECMCKAEMMEGMLDQAQVAEYVKNCRVKTTHNACGLKRDMCVTFSTPEAAKRCVQHFNGRQWGVSRSILKATLAKSGTRFTRAHDIECCLGSCVPTQHRQNVQEVPPGLGGVAHLAAAPLLPSPELETFMLQPPPGLGLSHEQICSKWQSFAEDSTDAGTSGIDDDPADEEAQITMSL